MDDFIRDILVAQLGPLPVVGVGFTLTVLSAWGAFKLWEQAKSLGQVVLVFLSLIHI